MRSGNSPQRTRRRGSGRPDDGACGGTDGGDIGPRGHLNATTQDNCPRPPGLVLNEPNENSWQRIREGWPDRHYFLTDRIAFVTTEDLILTQQISTKVGMNKEDRISGLVIEATNRSGWNDSGFVEWLGKFS